MGGDYNGVPMVRSEVGQAPGLQLTPGRLSENGAARGFDIAGRLLLICFICIDLASVILTSS